MYYVHINRYLSPKLLYTSFYYKYCHIRNKQLSLTNAGFWPQIAQSGRDGVSSS